MPDESGTQDPAYPSVWTRPRRAVRDRPTLTRDQIVAEAVRLLDEEGYEALSMRRLGARLGSAATALYWHVGKKEELIELVIDDVYGEIELPALESPEAWREAATRFFHSARTVILRHPWLSSMVAEIGLASLGPNLIRFTDHMIGVFHTAGFPLLEADLTMNTAFSYVLGGAMSEAAVLAKIGRSGEDAPEWLTTMQPALEAAAAPYPRLLEVFKAYATMPVEHYRERQFDDGLQMILDGMEARLDHHPPRPK